MKELAKKLINVEHELNKEIKVYFLGSLIADHLRYVFLNQAKKNKESISGELLGAIKLLFKFLAKSSKPANINGGIKVIFGRSGQKHHHHRLVDYLEDEYKSESMLFDKGYKNAIALLPLSKRIKIFFNVLKKLPFAYKSAKKKLTNYGLIPYQSKLITNLTGQLIKFEAAMAYLQSIAGLKLVVVDYDRSTFSALVLAANALNIKTVSFQHGAINPPYGYVPLIANEIWVWGNTWKKSLVAMNVPASNIQIVGSTIAEHFPNHKSARIKTIGIGPNPIGFYHNFALWSQLTVELTDLGYEVIVKLHPSMKVNDEVLKIFGSKAKIVNAAEMSNPDFLSRIDLLVISNSGLGYEAVLANVPVAVKRQAGSIGNDDMMITEGSFPELISGSKLKQQILSIQENYQEVLASETDYVSKNIYQQTGNEARLATIKLINNYIDGVAK
ncbi:hypothetical protein [Mucilaginibacter phyllosphaerae]|uniref:UDP-N-acetylglucosamine 2-epimerase domain-containing protein n=1 Tax=Mucilaginibacter phyllosphaerae TaxID=1812349 RepID=A0A4Y8AHX9_9SPHI|nr:hypothetical protein [Mucilaginibacter phyllosphaerae]MBB3968633.1 hypothetical protein [Mucilaginibacter phyllosphaerae]TEW67729.1 hypothetical protein E2R65_07005 [Mucilaginibacter phyllosphaerae]GGH14809.1 hypothetical protein GCM10007352_23160 [Mucilaginibacter phyllosphaerae]